MAERIPLTALPMRLKAILGDATPSYRNLYYLMLDGTFTLRRDEGCRPYYAEEQDIPAIAEAIRRVIALSSVVRRTRRPRRTAAMAA